MLNEAISGRISNLRNGPVFQEWPKAWASQVRQDASLLQSNSQQKNPMRSSAEATGPGIAAKLREMPLSRREKHYAKVHAMAQCWPVPPGELLWVGGTYARHPKYVPEHQNEHAWVHGKLRPLGIQPDAFLSKLHQAGVNRFAPIESWCKIWDEDAMFRHFPGALNDTVRAGKLWTYMETHELHHSLWYGRELRNKRKHHTSILEHPLQDTWCPLTKSFCRRRSLYLRTAPCIEEVVSHAGSRGFPRAEGTATENASSAA